MTRESKGWGEIMDSPDFYLGYFVLTHEILIDKKGGGREREEEEKEE